MEFNLNIQKLGKVNDIFSFYQFITQQHEFKNTALLESVDENSKDMLFSFIGINPDFIIKVCGDDLQISNIESELGEELKNLYESGEIRKNNIQELSLQPDLPFEDEVSMKIKGIELLRDIIPISRSALPELFPRKVFSGGLLGYIGYDVMAPFVGYKPSQESIDEFPDIIMGLYSNVLVYSHQTNALYHITNNLGQYSHNNEPQDLVNKYIEKFPNYSESDLFKKLGLTPEKFIEIKNREINFKSNTSLEEWTDMIEKTKEHIVSGDIIQAVISRKMIETAGVKPLDVYRALRILNPSPYMFYLDYEGIHNGDIRIIGSSPEALITKNQTTLSTVPIAGTRRRGKNAEDEKRMEKELLTSIKERSEHIMLVDLARNDLSRVSMPGTIETYKLMQLKKFPNVMHLISKVRSTSYKDPFTILESMFPAGTVSGAPKKRAMEIIQSIEKENRGPYAGTVGYISYTGDMDMAISIRTIFNKNKKYIAQAGAGIVSDSTPEEEYLETANKMKGILSSINLARFFMEFVK